MGEILKVPAGETVYLGEPANPIDPNFIASLGNALVRCKPLTVAEAHLPQVHLKSIDKSLKAIVVVFKPPIDPRDAQAACLSLARWLDANSAPELYVWPMRPDDQLLQIIRTYDCRIKMPSRRRSGLLRWLFSPSKNS